MIWLFLFSVTYTLFMANAAFGQPGPQPTLADLQKRYQPRLDALAIQIGSEQLKVELYLERSRIYSALARQAGHEHEPSAAYFDNALTDLTTAIGIEPAADLYAERAFLRQLMHPNDPAATPQGIVDRFLIGYDDEIADFGKAIELAKSESQLARLYAELSRVISARVQPLAKPAVIQELEYRKVKYALWDDFDYGIALSQKAYDYGKKLDSWLPDQYRSNVANSYLAKASAAHDLNELEIELSSYREGEKFISQGYLLLCQYYSNWGDALLKKGLFQKGIDVYTRALTSEVGRWNCRSLLSRRAVAHEAMGDIGAAIDDYTAESKKESWADISGELYINRARLYVKLGQADKALDDLTEALPKYFNNQCPQIYRLRANVERQLGDTGAARDDEERAAKLAKSSVPAYCTNFGP